MPVEYCRVGQDGGHDSIRRAKAPLKSIGISCAGVLVVHTRKQRRDAFHRCLCCRLLSYRPKPDTRCVAGSKLYPLYLWTFCTLARLRCVKPKHIVSSSPCAALRKDPCAVRYTKVPPFAFSMQSTTTCEKGACVTIEPIPLMAIEASTTTYSRGKEGVDLYTQRQPACWWWCCRRLCAR